MSSFVSRFVLSCSLVATLSSAAGADRIAAPHFAQPPHTIQAYEPDLMPHRALDRASVRAALAKARATNLAAFRTYQQKGVFPSNTFQARKLNVWRDADGHYCAAATIIKMSGQDELVGRVAEQTNFIRLADVRQGPLMDWMLTSGFTQDEIAMIQEPFAPVANPRPQPEPAPVLVDAKLRKAEDARLRAKYTTVTKALVSNEQASLELATDRLMKRPELAWQLVDRS